jgi:predicted nucleotide-binding protein
MDIDRELKPLYANLMRLEIGNYLYTKQFEFFMLENNLDEAWSDCRKEANRNNNVIILGHHDTEIEEAALALLLSEWYDQDYDSFGNFITTVLLNFATWHRTKLDYGSIHDNLKELNLSDKNLLAFTKAARKIRDAKPEVLVEETIQLENTPKINLDSKKVFIVHGHDETARLELSKFIKDDLGLEPIILQEAPNTSLETIITKFERLAKDCSYALILFTPDDEANGKARARQNVILELGYFLGKFQDPENRRIAIIKKGEVEIPSDISGVLYLEYQKHLKELYYDLKKQFEAWGAI